jgi:hypothetical protein
MKKQIDGLTLYHGSYCEVSKPDLKKCAKYKDFGQGFYLTSSKKQAENFIRTSVKKAFMSGMIFKNQNYGIVSTFRFNMNADVKIRNYPEANVDWLHCVVGHRKINSFQDVVQELQQFDIISGKIANDNTNATIAAYMALAYGEMGTKTADDMCISLLLPERLQDQFCFRTDRALTCLAFVESERIWL